jgi:hypothetical protein
MPLKREYWADHGGGGPFGAGHTGDMLRAQEKMWERMNYSRWNEVIIYHTDLEQRLPGSVEGLWFAEGDAEGETAALSFRDRFRSHFGPSAAQLPLLRVHLNRVNNHMNNNTAFHVLGVSCLA